VQYRYRSSLFNCLNSRFIKTRPFKVDLFTYRTQCQIYLSIWPFSLTAHVYEFNQEAMIDVIYSKPRNRNIAFYAEIEIERRSLLRDVILGVTLAE